MNPDETLSPEALLHIYRHARREHPRECCGFVRRTQDQDHVRPCANRIEDRGPGRAPSPTRNAMHGFEITGTELEELKQSIEAGGRAPLIVYHSHCNADAAFSREDVLAALAGGLPVEHLVVAVTPGRIEEARLYRQQGIDFVEIQRFAGADL